MPNEFYVDDTSWAMVSDVTMLNILSKLSDKEQDKLINWVATQREKAFVSGMNYQGGNEI